MMNILNGGAHADTNVDIQEFMIAPIGAASFREALQQGAEVYHALKAVLKKKGLATGVGDEGGFAPDLPSNRAALDLIAEAVKSRRLQARHRLRARARRGGQRVLREGQVHLRGQEEAPSKQMTDYYADLVSSYPIVSHRGPARRGRLGRLEDDDRPARRQDPDRRRRPVRHQRRAAPAAASPSGQANALLVKVNQIGSLTETLDSVELAHRNGFRCMMSHRSGETEDTTIADLAVATNCGQIKTGAPARSERVAKYNQLLRIEEELDDAARYAGRGAFPRYQG